jgi:hypothetical protein
VQSVLCTLDHEVPVFAQEDSVDTWTPDGESIVEHVAGVEDYQVAVAPPTAPPANVGRHPYHLAAGRTSDRGQPPPARGVGRVLINAQSLRLSFLIALTQYLFDSLHDWHLKVLLVAAIIGHLAHIFFEGLQIKDAVVAFGIVITAEPRGDEPRLTDFVMHELVTVDFRNVDRHLGVARRGSCKGKDGYQSDADAVRWHKTLH